MRKLLNTLYVVSPERYLALEGETVLVLEQGKRLPEFLCTTWRG